MSYPTGAPEPSDAGIAEATRVWRYSDEQSLEGKMWEAICAYLAIDLPRLDKLGQMGAPEPSEEALQAAFEQFVGNGSIAIVGDTLRSRVESTIRAYLAIDFPRLPVEPSGCPCALVTPCSPNCSCANAVMSGGCHRCCKYGSLEQRLAMATDLAARLPAAREPERGPAA